MKHLGICYVKNIEPIGLTSLRSNDMETRETTAITRPYRPTVKISAVLNALGRKSDRLQEFTRRQLPFPIAVWLDGVQRSLSAYVGDQVRSRVYKGREKEAHPRANQ